MELISIIVPVYNVQAYLERCLDSILGQSYTNIEILTVDDGSTDESGRICDEYEKKDARIHVIHKKNGGLSDARNAGMEAAHGSYLMFVDSDDVVDRRIVEKLYRMVCRHRADVGICDPVHCSPGEQASFVYTEKEMLFSPEEAIAEMLYQKSFLMAAWGKLYSAKLLKQIQFPVGMLFEDSAVMYRIFDRAKRIVHSPSRLYGYLHRENSITTGKFSKRDLDILTICGEMERYFAGRSAELRAAVTSYHMSAAFRIYLNAPRTEEYKDAVSACKRYLDDNYRKVQRDRSIRKKLRLALLLYQFARPVLPYIYSRVDRWS